MTTQRTERNKKKSCASGKRSAIITLTRLWANRAWRPACFPAQLACKSRLTATHSRGCLYTITALWRWIGQLGDLDAIGNIRHRSTPVPLEACSNAISQPHAETYLRLPVVRSSHVVSSNEDGVIPQSPEVHPNKTLHVWRVLLARRLDSPSRNLLQMAFEHGQQPARALHCGRLVLVRRGLRHQYIPLAQPWHRRTGRIPCTTCVYE